MRRAGEARRPGRLLLCKVGLLAAVAAGALGGTDVGAQTRPSPDIAGPKPKSSSCAPLPAPPLPASSSNPVLTDPQSLAGIAGRYEFLPDLLFTVTLRGDKLFASLGDDTAEMLPLGGDRFLVKDAGIELIPQRNAKGDATCLVALQRGDRKAMPRVD